MARRETTCFGLCRPAVLRSSQSPLPPCNAGEASSIVDWTAYEVLGRRSASRATVRLTPLPLSQAPGRGDTREPTMRTPTLQSADSPSTRFGLISDGGRRYIRELPKTLLPMRHALDRLRRSSRVLANTMSPKLSPKLLFSACKTPSAPTLMLHLYTRSHASTVAQKGKARAVWRNGVLLFSRVSTPVSFDFFRRLASSGPSPRGRVHRWRCANSVQLSAVALGHIGHRAEHAACGAEMETARSTTSSQGSIQLRKSPRYVRVRSACRRDTNTSGKRLRLCYR
jgi:hypothetical protein